MPATRMISVRMPGELKELLESTAETSGESRSALMQRYIDEGLRMDRHPGIVFRSGPAGRRCGLAGGPDVWEVIRVVRNADGRGERAVAEAASWLGLSPAQVRIAVDYYADFAAEIDDWLARVDREAAEGEAAWSRRQAVLR